MKTLKNVFYRALFVCLLFFAESSRKKQVAVVYEKICFLLFYAHGVEMSGLP
jgi:hypothetical protein